MKWKDFKQSAERAGLRDDDEVRSIHWTEETPFTGIELRQYEIKCPRCGQDQRQGVKVMNEDY